MLQKSHTPTPTSTTLKILNVFRTTPAHHTPQYTKHASHITTHSPETPLPPLPSNPSSPPAEIQGRGGEAEHDLQARSQHGDADQPPSGRLLFLLRSEKGLVLGRLWSSRGKARG